MKENIEAVGKSPKERTTKTLTPGSAIRRFCLQCVGSSSEIKHCGGDNLLSVEACHFFKYRMGRGRPSVKAIRKECLHCMNGSSAFVSGCASMKCPVHKFRLGTNPNYAGSCRAGTPFIAQI
jgi:hypothetical protein